MEVRKTSIKGCFELQPRIFEDTRGKLVKTFHEGMFSEHDLSTDFTEEYYSISKKNVLRGLHFQLPPNDHVKCVTCLQGKLFDVVVDLRKESDTFGKHLAIELDGEKGNMLYIPKGLAHGFLVLSDNAIFLNRTTTVYNADSDTGIHWNSCNINWPVKNPILSDKDRLMTELKDFITPFN